MKLSNKGLLEIAEHEGIVPAPYRDSVGVWTYGIGHTAAAGGLDPQVMDKAFPSGPAYQDAIEQAIDVFQEDVVKYENRVRKALKVPVKQHEFDALVSFDFNTGGIHRAKLTEAINAGEVDAADRFMGWLKPPEIRKRRTAEMNLFLTGDYDANGSDIPIWKTDGAGNLKGIHGRVSGKDLLRRMGRELEEPVVTERSKYIKPESWTWRGGVALAVAALVMVTEPLHGQTDLSDAIRGVLESEEGLGAILAYFAVTIRAAMK